MKSNISLDSGELFGLLMWRLQDSEITPSFDENSVKEFMEARPEVLRWCGFSVLECAFQNFLTAKIQEREEQEKLKQWKAEAERKRRLEDFIEGYKKDPKATLDRYTDIGIEEVIDGLVEKQDSLKRALESANDDSDWTGVR